MTRGRLRLAAIAATVSLGAAAASCAAQVTSSNGGYLFRMKFVKGAKYSYTFGSSTAMPGMSPVSMSWPMTMTVTAVQGNVGTVHLDSKSPMASKPVAMDLKFDDHGKPVGGSLPGGMNISEAMPDKAVRVGESFTTKNTVNLPMAGKPVTVTTVIKLVGVHSVGGRQVAVMNVTSHATGGLTVDSTGTEQVAVSDGWPISLHMTSHITMALQGKTQNMTTVTSMTRK